MTSGAFYVPAEWASHSKFIVVLNEDSSDEDFECAVAHELAHLELGHPAADLFLDVAANENAAAAKAREWGFTGFGALPFDERS